MLFTSLIEKVIQIYFKRSDPNLLLRESLGRTSKNSVSMKSVIGIESGHWITKKKKQLERSLNKISSEMEHNSNF